LEVADLAYFLLTIFSSGIIFFVDSST